jgi:hypothetical protein
VARLGTGIAGALAQFLATPEQCSVIALVSTISFP